MLFISTPCIYALDLKVKEVCIKFCILNEQEGSMTTSVIEVVSKLARKTART